MVSTYVSVTIVIFATSIGYVATVDAVYSYTSFVTRICNGKAYDSWSGHFNSPGVITGLIAKEVPDDPNFDLYDNIVNDDYILYGHGSCSGNLDRDQCATCMGSARDKLFAYCNWHPVGAQIELQGCKLRYEEYSFGPTR